MYFGWRVKLSELFHGVRGSSVTDTSTSASASSSSAVNMFSKLANHFKGE